MAHYRGLPAVARFQSAFSLERAVALIKDLADSDPSVPGRWFQFAIELRSEPRLIGDIGFLNTDEQQKSWVGFTLHPDYWHQGYAAEAVGAVLGYYRGMGIAKVWASIDPDNQSSAKLLGRLGFALVESKPDDLIFRLS